MFIGVSPRHIAKRQKVSVKPFQRLAPIQRAYTAQAVQ